MRLDWPGQPRHLRRWVLAGALAYFVLIGGTNVGAFIPEGRAINALIGAALVALWLWELPRRNDIVDRLVLLALLLFLVACVTSQFPRMSFDAAVNAVAYAAAFGVARTELASEGARRTFILLLAGCGFAVSLLLLSWWAPQWLAWIRESGTPPPFDLMLPAGIYRHHYYAAMLVALLLPALVEASRRAILRVAVVAGVVASLAVIVMAGSRTIWVALIVVVAGLLALAVRSRPRLLLWLGGVAAAVAVSLAVSGTAVQLIARVVDFGTLGTRLAIWSTALEQWAARPLVGIGPGGFGPGVTLGDFFELYQEVPLNAHNAVVQQLMEGGIIGLVSLGLVVAAVAIGSRGRPAPLFALAALALFALMTLTDNPSTRPNLAVLAIAWAAYAVPRSGVYAPLAISTRRSTWTAVATGVAGVFVALSVSSTIAAAGAFEQARVALREGDLVGARESLDAAVDLDPAMTLYLRERGVRAAEAGEVESALADLQRAAQMNPADATAQRALAILLARAGALQLGLAHAQAALELGEEQAENALTLAHVSDMAGDDRLRHDALAAALAADPYLAGAPTWPTMFPTGTDLDELLAAALPLRLASLDDRGRHEYPEAWLPAATGSPPLAGAGAGLLAIDAVIRCELQGAGEILASAPTRDANGVVGLTARIMLGQVTGDTAEVQRARDLARLWRHPLVDLTVDGGSPASPFSDPAEDVRLYERNPLPPPNVEPLLPTMEEGLAAWLQDPRGAARRGAPASALAHCRSG